MIYLGQPYAHSDKKIVELRRQAAAQFTQGMLLQGKYIFSPIVYGTALHPENYDWLSFDLDMVPRCSEFWVLCLPRWEQSDGLRWELEKARFHSLPIAYSGAKGLIDPEIMEALANADN